MSRLSGPGTSGEAASLSQTHDEIAAEFWRRFRLACAGPTRWNDRIWAAGLAAMRYLREDPARARLLLAADDDAGVDALERRDRLVRRLAALLDREPRQAPRSGSRRSSATAEVAAGAIYRMLVTKVEAGAIERGEEFLPELVYMAVMPYLGAEAAADQLAVQPLH